MGIMHVLNSAVFCVLILYGSSASAEKHSLYYSYTGLSKAVDVYLDEFTAVGLLDDRQIDYYDNKDQTLIPRQNWMKEKLEEDYWEKGTRLRRAEEQWIKDNLNWLMRNIKHNESDLHVLQWRHGCEVEQQGDEVKFTKNINEYGYDGEDFLYFDDKEDQWVASDKAAEPTKSKWDNIPILNQYLKGYLERECVDWLKMFREYADEELRSGSPPDVRVFAKKSTKDKTKLKLSCLVTGFFPKDVMLSIRKNNTAVPDDEVESTGVRPNHDGSFQKRISVEIKEDDKAGYDCFVSHRTFKEPITFEWECQDCLSLAGVGLTGAVLGGVFVLAVVGFVFYVLLKAKIIDVQTTQDSRCWLNDDDGQPEIRYDASTGRVQRTHQFSA